MKKWAILVAILIFWLSPAHADAELWVFTGQSNIDQLPACSPTCSWPSNAKVWNNNIDGSSVGNAFAALDPNHTSMQAAFVAERARQYPARTVYLVQIGLHDSPIARWINSTPPPSPNLWQGISNSVPAALASAGLSTISGLGWWQWESDAIANSKTWVANFETVVGQFKAQPWFPGTTPVLIFGGAGAEQQSSIGNADDFMNTYVRAAAHNDPVNRRYVNAASYPMSFWSTTSPAHMTAQGYTGLGTAVADAFNGTGTASDGLMTRGTPVLTDVVWPLWAPTIKPGNGTFQTPPTVTLATYRESGSLVHIDVEYGIVSNLLTDGVTQGTQRIEVTLPFPAKHSAVCSAVNGFDAIGLAAYVLDSLDLQKIIIFQVDGGYPPTSGNTLVSCDIQRG